MSLEEPVAARGQTDSEWQSASSPGGLEEARLAKIISITEDLFGVKPTFDSLFDPEDPEACWTIVKVCCPGEVRHLVQQRVKWHERIGRLGLANHPRLSIIPVG